MQASVIRASSVKLRGCTLCGEAPEGTTWAAAQNSGLVKLYVLLERKKERTTQHNNNNIILGIRKKKIIIIIEIALLLLK